MKKIITSLFVCFIPGLILAQNGLEDIIVEKYYISDASDTVANVDGGVLPVRSVTYRIYADMLPGYKFQAVYGEDIIPFGLPPTAGDHELRIETSTLFFNNQDRGTTVPGFTKAQSRLNTVMLDSYLSVGAACAGNFGILKAEDDTVATVVNNYVPQVLQNTDTAAGIPVKDKDGMILITGRAPEALTAVGITTEIGVFNDQNDGTNGPLFSTWNGSWASLNGSVGPDTIANKVLIAQITTDGIFSFQLNIQIGTPSGGVEKYVAMNPVGAEIQLASLSQTFLPPPPVEVHNLVRRFISSIKAYPNPVNEFLMVEINSEGYDPSNYLSMFDITGKEVLRKGLQMNSGKYIEMIDVSMLAGGEYILNLNVDGQSSAKTIIIN